VPVASARELASALESEPELALAQAPVRASRRVAALIRLGSSAIALAARGCRDQHQHERQAITHLISPRRFCDEEIDLLISYRPFARTARVNRRALQ
jgi:hypothetical protein